MKKIVWLLLFSIASVLGQQVVNVLGFASIILTTAGNFGVTTTNFLDVMHYEVGGHTVTNFQLTAAAITGSPVTADQTVEVQADSGNNPSGTALCTLTNSTTVAAGAILNFGGSCALSDATQYHLVAKNATGSTTVSYRIWQNVPPTFMTSANSSGGSGYKTYNGTTWAVTTLGQMPMYRMDRNDSTYRGFPFTAIVSGTGTLGTNEKIFGTSKYFGAAFTTPANAKPNVLGVDCSMGKNGTPSGTLSAALYKDDGTNVTLVASGIRSISAGELNTTTSPLLFRFSTVQTLLANTGYIFAAIDSAADSSSNYYYYDLVTVENAAGSLSLTPMSGTWRAIGCTSGASCIGASTRSNWTVTYNLPKCDLVLDPAGEFTSTGGAGATTHMWGFAK